MAMIGKVLRMHRRDQKSVREIVKATSLARNTVRKYLRAEGVDERRRYRRESVATKLTPFAEAIKQALQADAHRPKKERRTAKALLKEIGAAGYAGATRDSRTSFATGGCSKAAQGRPRPTCR